MTTETKIVPELNQNLSSLQALRDLAEKNRILRMSAATGKLTTNEAIDFIKKYGKVVEESSFPKSLYSHLR